jgi:hypothetical protein
LRNGGAEYPPPQIVSAVKFDFVWQVNKFWAKNEYSRPPGLKRRRVSAARAAPRTRDTRAVCGFISAEWRRRCQKKAARPSGAIQRGPQIPPWQSMKSKPYAAISVNATRARQQSKMPAQLHECRADHVRSKGRRGTRKARLRIRPTHTNVLAHRCQRLWMMMAAVGNSPPVPPCQGAANQPIQLRVTPAGGRGALASHSLRRLSAFSGR